MNIIKNNFKYNGVITSRLSTKYIILHHRAGDGNVESIHKQHLAQGYSGIGYHFYIRKDGNIYEGRPLNKQGAHCKGSNYNSVGVCFEGNFETEYMTDAQIKAGSELLKYLFELYPQAKVVGHRDMMATVCPGKNFDINKILNYKEKTVKKLESANDIIWELMNGSLKVPISEVGKAVKALDKAKASTEFESLYWILYKIVNKVG